MSPTRKPKPPDKGVAPDHKPSRKVTLDEVLRSLQDLVSNELAVEPAKPVPPPAETTAAADAESAPITETPATPAEETPLDLEPEGITLPGLPDTPAQSPPKPEPLRLAPPGGQQQELPYLDLTPDTPAEDEGTRPSPPASTAPVQDSVAEALPESAPALAAPDPIVHRPGVDFSPPGPPAAGAPVPDHTDETGHPAEDGTLSDIPVLEDAVELADELEASAAGPMLPAAAEARRLAIQVAARLNVELRKAGKTGLSSDVITRLAHLLEETLAKGTANMDNTRSEKH